MKTNLTNDATAIETTIATLLAFAEQYSDSCMDEEMQTALRAAQLLMMVREEREEAAE